MLKCDDGNMIATLDNTTEEEPGLAVLRSEVDAYITAEVVEQMQLSNVHRAMRELADQGVSIEALSDTSGLPVDQIIKVLEQRTIFDDIEDLACLR